VGSITELFDEKLRQTLSGVVAGRLEVALKPLIGQIAQLSEQIQTFDKEIGKMPTRPFRKRNL
jgi:hypothetical protein